MGSEIVTHIYHPSGKSIINTNVFNRPLLISDDPGTGPPGLSI